MARVLIVDDTDIVRKALEKAVQKMGHSAVSTSDSVEALGVGVAGGLPAWQIVEVIQASSFHSPLFLVKGELVEKGDYAPRFAVSLAEKDQRLAQEAAAELGAKVPINEAVRRLLAAAVESGRGDKDVAAVADLFFEWARKK